MKLSKAQQKALGIPPAPKAKVKVDQEESKALFLATCKAHSLPAPFPEFRFCNSRKWRFDYAWPGAMQNPSDPSDWLDCNVALEIQGGLYTRGRHTQGAALVKEYEKLNEAQIMGWKVLLVTPKQVETGEAFALVRRALGL